MRIYTYIIIVLCFNFNSAFSQFDLPPKSNVAPEIGQEIEQTLGNSIIGTNVTSTNIYLAEDLQFGYKGSIYSIKAGSYLPKRSTKELGFDYILDSTKVTKLQLILRFNKNYELLDLVENAWVNKISFKKIKEVKLEFKPETKLVSEYSNGNVFLEFIYNGKIDNKLQFTYREYYRNENNQLIIRDAFTQNLQYDLNEGRVLSFKKLKFEVLETSNNTLKYKIISHF